ncbi:MAG: ABC transporter permease [Syntrophobacteraceae bacterium]|jgi:ABC-2 type transport system permease protein/ribosome-dependent ATPase|nr:ABC transporter permease [Syntrophobacteraceae bacterium]
MNLRRILAVASRERREVVRDRLFFALAFIVPPVLLLTFGHGLSLDVEKSPFAVVDYDRTPMSRDYLHGFMASRQFSFKGFLETERDVYGLLASGKVRSVIIIPEQFQERLLAGRPVAVQTLIDGTFPFRAQTTRGYVVAVNAAFSSNLLSGHLARTSGMDPELAERMLEPIRTEVRCLYNPSLKSDWSLAPRLMMMVLMICPPLLTAMGVVREKETGAITNIYSSTITRSEYLLGKLAPYIGVSILNIVVLWVITVKVFGAPFKGDPLFFFLASVLYVLCTTGMGLIVSVLVRTQVAAILITFIVTVVPSVFYSGIFVPVPSLGEGARVVAHLLPAMYYTDIVAGCFLKGVGIQVLWREVLVLAGYAAVLAAIGYSMFHKRPAS